MPQRVIADALVETVHELRPLRSWADDAHVATQHVPELRQLIQPGLADEAPDPGDPVVVFSSPTGHAIALGVGPRSEEHTSELQSLMRNSYAVFCLKKKQQ